MNILSKIEYDGIIAEIEFPIDDDSLNQILRSSHLPTDTTMPFYVKSIDYPNVLSVLTGRTVNLDEMNYLAKRLDCLDEDEILCIYL